MAIQEHLDILMKGVGTWNQWRKEHPETHPNLSGVDLIGAHLGDADLSGANLSGTNLYRAVLSYANLSGASLSGASLWVADLNGANLTGADLTGADLNLANLSNSLLSSANLIGAKLGYTIIGGVDLSGVKGLEDIQHLGPSTIGIDTIYMSHSNLPEAFLRGAGLDDTFITYIRSLAAKPTEYYSCFISYSAKDMEIAERIYDDLQRRNIRCWFAPEDLKIGVKTRVGIDEAIRFHDKLLLILSAASVASEWVEYEVETALAKERKESRTILYPIRIDNAVMESDTAWAAMIKNMRNIGDFTKWKRQEGYEKGFNRLLRDLKQSNSTGTTL